MSAGSVLSRLWFLILLSRTIVPAVAGETNASHPTYRDVKFTQPAPYSTKAEITRRFGYPEPFPDLEIANEEFQMIVPSTYATNSGSGSNWGLLVWISPGNSPGLPRDWPAELARHQMLVVSAANAGNERHLVDRLRLALDATGNVYRQFKIDRKRIYVGGMSGGGRVASMLGVACADIFTGTLSVCGVNFYRDIPDAQGKRYPSTYLPDPRVLPLAKKSGRYVLLTGEFDPNRENTKDTCVKGFQQNGFKNVLYHEVPGMKHALPGAAELGKALDYLHGKAIPGTNSVSPP